ERALDREAGLRGFGPSPAQQEVIWTELGRRHPLAAQLQAAPGTLVLIGRDGWQVIPDGSTGAGWAAVDAALALHVPGVARPLAPLGAWRRREIELRLAGGRRAAPSLWLMRQGGVAAVDKLLAHLPEDVVARLTFAVAAGDGDPVVILRARGGRHAPPELVLPAEAYAPIADMPDVYSPAGTIVEPPLRRERLRTILGATGAEVLWLAAEPDRRFRVERIADSAFQPLAEWADYVLHTSAAALAPWMRATELAFAPYVSTGLEWASGPPAGPDPSTEERRKRARAPRAMPAAPAPELPLAVSHAEPAPAPAEPRPADAPRELVLDQDLIELETRFVELDAGGDAPERIALLLQLGQVYARLGRRRDAALCFVRAVWEAPAGETIARLHAWIAADRGLAGSQALARLLDQAVPDPDDVRVIAALTATADPARLGDPHRVQRWLDDHDGELDARSLWLARLGLARLAGGDPLGLAHARDRILARLAGGLSVEHELPAFLRLSARAGALGNASGGHLTRALDELAQRLARTRRKRSPTEAPVQYTTAYTQLQLAHGFAKIGGQDRARELVAGALDALQPVAADPVHAYLAAAFAARVEQAIGGQPPEAPLPDPLGAQLAALDRVSRYKVDRLREASRILEPLERPDAIGAFSQHQHDARGPEFAALRGMTDARARGRAVASLVDTAAQAPEERARLLDGVLDVLLELPESAAAPILARAWPMIAQVAEPRRAVLYADALIVAGHFGRTEIVPELLSRLSGAIRVVAATDLERVLQHSLRALRRIGLRSEIASLLADAEHALPATGPAALHGRLALAAGMAYLGDAEHALPILRQAGEALDADFALVDPKQGTKVPLQRPLELTRALALAYAYVPLGTAIAGITELASHFKDITDNFGTNSHYCLSVLHFVESLVLGITSEDLAIGEAGRRFIEDDEHLIRRRLHRDLGGTH
ncbi:MAG TPA: hypothetical protein VGC42_08480, partial [Kofleriaceae bacterium]